MTCFLPMFFPIEECDLFFSTEERNLLSELVEHIKPISLAKKHVESFAIRRVDFSIIFQQTIYGSDRK